MQRAENPKRSQIIITAKNLFWKFGMKRVSVEEICREAGVSKMTFYKYFKNKNDLAIILITIMQEEAFKKYNTFMNQDIPFKDKVKHSIHFKMEQTDQLSSEFFNDLHKNEDKEITLRFQKIFQKGIQIILNDYLEAQKRGDIRNDIKPEFILYFLSHMGDMAKDEKLSKLYDTPQEMIMELTRFFFYGILPREEKTKNE